jgi:hypothetical protein
MTRVRKNRGLFAFLLVSIFLTAGCGSSSSKTSGVNQPYAKQDISGVWVGYMSSKLNSTFIVGFFTTEDNDHFSGRLIGQDKFNQYKQFISPDGFFLTETPNSALFTGVLEDCSWNTSGLVPDYSVMKLASSELPSLNITGPAATKRVFGGPPFGAFSYISRSETGILALYYNTTYDVPPDINNIKGQWEIHDSIMQDNTVMLSITPNTADTKGAFISGLDDRGNTFNGTITIYYSPLDNKPHNLYDVNLTLKNTTNTIDLNGLAAYVLESTTNGISIPKKTLAIGATNNDRSYSFSGLAEFIK